MYFRYYLDRAMAENGLGDLYLRRLGTWEFMLNEGLTTFAEQDNPYSRSDCHAWAASPNAEFLRTVLGVDSAAPGFAKVRVRPNLGRCARSPARSLIPRVSSKSASGGKRGNYESKPRLRRAWKFSPERQKRRQPRRRARSYRSACGIYSSRKFTSTLAMTGTGDRPCSRA